MVIGLYNLFLSEPATNAQTDISDTGKAPGRWPWLSQLDCKSSHLPPLGGTYGRYQILNWATEFYVDALSLLELSDIDGESDMVCG